MIGKVNGKRLLEGPRAGLFVRRYPLSLVPLNLDKYFYFTIILFVPRKHSIMEKYESYGG
jgi:hypothetical protein